MRAAITGATGHVGCTLARTLLEAGHHVRAIVRRDSDALEGLPLETFRAGLDDPGRLAAAFAGCQVVFHVAGRISVRSADREEVERVNVGGTRSVIAACRAAGVRRLVHFSSIEAIESRPDDVPVDEDRGPADPGWASPYAVSKAAAEREAMAAQGDGLDVVVLNPTGIMGPFDFKPSLQGRTIMKIARGGYPVLVEGGFDFVDVRDVAAAAAAAAERAPGGRRYIIGGRWASMRELAGMICAEAGIRPPWLTVPGALVRALAPAAAGVAELFGREPIFTTWTLRVLHGNRAISHERAARELGYRPRPLLETIRDTMSWLEEREAAWHEQPEPGYTAAGGPRG